MHNRDNNIVYGCKINGKEEEEIKKNKQCTYCNQINHGINECHLKHGFPP